MDISVIKPLDGEVLTAYIEGSLLRKDEVQRGEEVITQREGTRCPAVRELQMWKERKFEHHAVAMN